MVFVADYSSGDILMADFSSDSLDSLTFDALPFGGFVDLPYGVDYDPILAWCTGPNIQDPYDARISMALCKA